eukprot:TRINITY_DN734_c0_g1_i2.p1 TRINITY_DN734_c0_g1~~TRINITY_DN734_c0_g1_i2.p1  ORF type:complete len:628 (-),score=154.02 TRINITY_DN734_c0_g1_i2:33-1916(-)
MTDSASCRVKGEMNGSPSPVPSVPSSGGFLLDVFPPQESVCAPSPAVRVVDLEFPAELQPSLGAPPEGDWERLERTLRARGSIGAAEALSPPSLSLLRRLQHTLREARWRVTVVLSEEAQRRDLFTVVEVLPAGELPLHAPAIYVAAVDVGSTTLALYLCDLRRGSVVATASRTNPQVSCGEDVMSRVSFAADSDENLGLLRDAVVSAINTMLEEALRSVPAGMCSCTYCSRASVAELALVGNTVMEHLFLGVDPSELGRSPFVLATAGWVTAPAAELGLTHCVAPAAPARWLPAVAGHVGADTVAVALALGATPAPQKLTHCVAPAAPARWLPAVAGHVGADTVAVALALGATPAPQKLARGEATVVLDLGTNCEIFVSADGKTYAAACPTGPAFEGAQVSCGMRASTGAVRRVHVDRASLDADVQLVGRDGWRSEWDGGDTLAVGVCGSGLIDAVAELLAAGVLLPCGRFSRAAEKQSPRLVWRAPTLAEFVLARADESSAGRAVAVTSRDVRAVQLAKGALAAGVRALLLKAGARPARYVLAGAFGAGVDCASVERIGMVPEGFGGAQWTTVGNAAGMGAVATLLDVRARRRAEALARTTTYVELAADPGFQDLFVAALQFPQC